MIAILLAALAIQSAPVPACSHDREALLALDQQAFDQDRNGGWRPLVESGCYAEAAELIAAYRERHGNQATILYWHEGQLRAMAGETTAAVALFNRARHPGGNALDASWNLYVDGSVAFLNRDRPALLAARDASAAMERPDTISVVVEDGTAHDVPLPAGIRWPPNLHVLDGLLACYAEPYAIAYACPPGGN